MKKWEVTLTATAYTTVVVEAENEYEAMQEARLTYRMGQGINPRNISTGEWDNTGDECPVEVAE